MESNPYGKCANCQSYHIYPVTPDVLADMKKIDATYESAQSISNDVRKFFNVESAAKFSKAWQDLTDVREFLIHESAHSTETSEDSIETMRKISPYINGGSDEAITIGELLEGLQTLIDEGFEPGTPVTQMVSNGIQSFAETYVSNVSVINIGGRTRIVLSY